MPSRSKREPCTYEGCSKARNRSCAKARCLSHCREDGPCPFHLTQSAQSRKSPSQVPASPSPAPQSPIFQPLTIPPTSSPLIPTPPSDPPIPMSLASTSNPPPQAPAALPLPNQSIQNTSLPSRPIPGPSSSGVTSHRTKGPRVATHMPDSFLSKYDEEQNRLGDKQAQELARKKWEMREKSEVIVHCWLKVRFSSKST